MAGGKKVSPTVLMVVGGLFLGAMMFALGRASAGKGAKGGTIPMVEQRGLQPSLRSLRVGGKELKAEGGNDAYSRAHGFFSYMAKGIPGLIQWDEAGRYPVLDVPEGWVVAWVVNRQVVAIGVPDSGGEAGRNLLVPANPVTAALVVPGSLGVKPGDAIDGI